MICYCSDGVRVDGVWCVADVGWVNGIGWVVEAEEGGRGKGRREKKKKKGRGKMKKGEGG